MTVPCHGVLCISPEVVDCLMVQYQFAVSIELAPFAIVITGIISIFHPLSWGNEVGFSLSV